MRAPRRAASGADAWARRSRAAVAAYREARGLAASEEIDMELLESLFGASLPGDTNSENDRACTTVQLTATEPEAEPVESAEPAQE